MSCLSDQNIFEFRCVGGERESNFFAFIFENFHQKWNKKKRPQVSFVKFFLREVQSLPNNILKNKSAEALGKKVTK